MNFKKFRRNVKAISPIISTLLLIAIAVVASLVAYAWVMGYIGFTTGNTGKSIQIQSLTASSVYVENIGNSPIMLNNPCVYINGTAVNGVSGTGSLNVGSTATLGGLGLTSGDYDTVKVVTSTGTFSQVTQLIP